MNLSSLANQFRTAANELGDGTVEDRDHLFETLRDCASALISAGSPGRAEMTHLMRDDSPWVSTWAATHLLTLGDETAEDVLAAISAQGGSSGFAADVILGEYRAGRLKSPFRADV